VLEPLHYMIAANLNCGLIVFGRAQGRKKFLYPLCVTPPLPCHRTPVMPISVVVLLEDPFVYVIFTFNRTAYCVTDFRDNNSGSSSPFRANSR
jgi:hypothetical protein